MKRHLTSVILVLTLAAFMALGYFVSPIFVDMLVMIFFAGSLYEMYKCLKDGGYHMFKAPPIFVLATAYPVFYLMQHYIGGGSNRVSAGIQGILIVALVGALLCLTIFTFKPADNKSSSKDGKSDNEAGDESGRAEEKCPEIAVASTQNTAENSDISAQKRCANDASLAEGSTENTENSVETTTESAKADGLNGIIASTDKRRGGACGLNDLFANVFLIVYPSLFLCAAFVISYKYSAFFAILFAILVPIIGSDMFAYLFGKTIGGKKLCPSISPKKTVAGACGGLFGGVLVAMLLWVIFEYVGGELAPEFIARCGYQTFFAHENGGRWKSALVYIALGAACAAISELGDLAASRIKRALGIKDYGKIFPGHGGFLDRIDSVMYSLVVLLVAFSCIYGY